MCPEEVEAGEDCVGAYFYREAEDLVLGACRG